jgi:hypothetical protein
VRSSRIVASILALVLAHGSAVAGEWDSLVESYGKLREARRENFVRVLARKNPADLDAALAALIQAHPVDADMIVMTAVGTAPQRGDDIREGLRAGLGMSLEQLKTLDRKLVTLLEHEDGTPIPEEAVLDADEVVTILEMAPDWLDAGRDDLGWSVLAPGGLEGKSFHEVRAEAEKEGVIVERLRKLDAEGGLELGVRRDPQGRTDLLGGGR